MKKLVVTSWKLEWVRHMPPLKHYPYRGKSEVLEYFKTDPRLMHWLFDILRYRGVILYDQKSKTWRGANYR